ncbi:uncharacterized protein LOC107489394 [Arachis duranensis]|uniref:Uncharacterized protein LOC107489394 n=1 Tax=Arachis duranensis TaxID=130453 RepID=A0A6P5NPM3_ARADU|nr:uncharacterized protein LOC107489394 [Arachis duranensis]
MLQRLLRRRSAPVTAPATICLAELSSDEIVCSLQRRSPLLQRRFSSGNNLRKRARNFIKLYEICCAFPPTIFSYGDLLHQRFSSMRSVAQVFPVASSCILRLFHLYRASLSIWVFDFLPCQKKLEKAMKFGKSLSNQIKKTLPECQAIGPCS